MLLQTACAAQHRQQHRSLADVYKLGYGLQKFGALPVVLSKIRKVHASLVCGIPCCQPTEANGN